MNHFVNNAKRSLRRMMGGSIIDIVCGLQILGVVTYLLSPEFFGYPESCAGCPGADLENCNVSCISAGSYGWRCDQLCYF